MSLPTLLHAYILILRNLSYTINGWNIRLSIAVAFTLIFAKLIARYWVEIVYKEISQITSLQMFYDVRHVIYNFNF